MRLPETPRRRTVLVQRRSHACVPARKRDRAHREIKKIFFKVIEKRRRSGENTDDILQTLVDATYK